MDDPGGDGTRASSSPSPSLEPDSHALHSTHAQVQQLLPQSTDNQVRALLLQCCYVSEQPAAKAVCINLAHTKHAAAATHCSASKQPLSQRYVALPYLPIPPC